MAHEQQQSDIRLDMLDYVEKSGAALQAAEDMITELSAGHAKVAAAVPACVEQLVNARLIDAVDKTAAHDMLSTHAGAIQIVRNLANDLEKQRESFAQKTAAMGGSGNAVAPGKRTSDEFDDGGYVGRRRGLNEKSAADKAFLEVLGLN